MKLYVDNKFWVMSFFFCRLPHPSDKDRSYIRTLIELVDIDITLFYGSYRTIFISQNKSNYSEKKHPLHILLQGNQNSSASGSFKSITCISSRQPIFSIITSILKFLLPIPRARLDLNLLCIFL